MKQISDQQIWGTNISPLKQVTSFEAYDGFCGR